MVKKTFCNEKFRTSKSPFRYLSKTLFRKHTVYDKYCSTNNIRIFVQQI